jgi:hypothetical protein
MNKPKAPARDQAEALTADLRSAGRTNPATECCASLRAPALTYVIRNIAFGR